MFTGSSPRTPSTSPDAAAPCETDAVITLSALEALREEWEALWLQARASPFQSPAWLVPWWKHVGRGQLAGIAARDSRTGELVGLAPLYIHTDTGGRRHLFPVGIATTDRLDVLMKRGREHDVARAMVTHLVQRADEWDLLEAPQLAQGAALLQLRWPAAWQTQVVACEPNPVVALPATLPARMQRNLANARHRAARAGLVYEHADAESVRPLIDALASLHAQRWALRGLPGVLGGEGILDWHREAAVQLHRAGLLRLFAARCEGEVVGVIYLLADAPAVPHRRWYSYIGGYLPALSSLGLGTLLIGHAIDQATAQDASAFDFLRGAESYKYRWGAVDEPMFTLRVRG
jgi:CelD/BcsL family acetyltransferase involved in cellulose biosynthesis